MTAHALLSASGMHRWSACPGSVNLTLRLRHEGLVVDRTSSYAAEGSGAHELGEKCLRQGVHADSYLGAYMATESDHPVEVTEEMVLAVQYYLDHVRAIEDEPDSCRFFIEQTFDLGLFYPGLFGTADAVVFHIPSRTLHVIDFKYGQGIPVEATNNPQLRYYALGAFVRLQEMKMPPPYPEKVCMTIVQPRAPHRAGPVRFETVDSMELLSWVDELITAAKATEPADAPLHAGEHCRFCPAAPRCPELLRLAQSSAQLAFAKVDIAQENDLTGPTPVKDLTHEQLRRALLASRVLEPWLKELHGHAQELLERGQVIEGWKLVQKRATRRWIQDPALTAMSLELLGLPAAAIFEEPELKSPAQVEKSLPKKRHPELSSLITKESSGVVLTHEADPRPAVRMALPFQVVPQLEMQA